MKNITILFVFLFCFQLFGQGTPKITIKDSKDLKLSSIDIKVNISGNIATTTYDMQFYNGLNRTLEGELAFPLGQGQSVSQFAMELNGELREAVVVEKELARVAYETTIRQQIDPALLEKVSGNNYKARVYPIFPKDNKRIVLTYEEKLNSIDGELVYELPLGINEKIDDFSLEISVYGTDLTPTIKSNSFDLSFVKGENGMKAKISKRKITPKKPVVIKMKNNLGNPKTLSYRDYFYSYIPLKPESRTKKKPTKVTFLWDVSYSMKNRNLEKEFDLLNSYLRYLQNVDVEFISFNNAIQNNKAFAVKNGNWTSLKNFIRSQNYDGGSNLESLKSLKIKSNEVILFSDGLANLGSLFPLQNKTVYSINSLISANHFSLEKTATKSGGSYINLSKLSVENASKLLKQETFQFIGIKNNPELFEVYPNSRTNVSGDFSIAGQSKKDTSIELQFGYQGEVTKTIILNLSETETSDLVKRLWAKEKLRSLNQEKEKNKKQIIAHSKRYQLISDYTSMIILDRIEDYVRYQIEPPKELRSRYKELIREADRNKDVTQKNIERDRKELFNDYQEVLSWYSRKFEKKKKKKKDKPELTQTTNNNPRNNPVTIRHSVDPNKRIISGIVSDTNGSLPGASLIIKGTRIGTDTDFDGKYAINAKLNDVLVFSYLGYETKEVTVGSASTINITMNEGGEVLDEVIVVSYGRVLNSRKSTASLARVDSKTIEQVPINTVDQVLQGVSKGIAVETASGQSGTIIIRGLSSLSGDIQPLFIIDGVPVDQDNFRSLNQNDIQTIEVLKDAAATSLYGNRGSGGVVIVTTKEGKKNNSQLIEDLEKKIADKIELKGWNPKAPYIDILKKEISIAKAYDKYLEIRNDYSNIPMFFIDVADFFDQKGARPLAVQIVTNLIEMELDNYELIKALAYKLEYFEQYHLAKKIYAKVLELRPEEPQSYRDLALACELVGDYQESFDLLYKIYNGELLEKDPNRRYDGIEVISFVEINRLVSKYGKHLNLTKEQKGEFKEIPMDVRVVVDWNHNDTDIDLWVFDPEKEQASFKNKETKIGGIMSEDMTEGYGPEQFLLKKAIKGKYDIEIDYYADNVQKISGPTILKVTMFTNYGKKNEERKMLIVKLEKEEDEIKVGNLFFN